MPIESGVLTSCDSLFHGRRARQLAAGFLLKRESLPERRFL
jgi:hypothetical protein